jgi:predicted aspartyl protease
MPIYRSRIGSVQFIPPAPVADLRVSNGSSVETVEALVDSGADATCIPEHVAERLELQPISILLVGGAGAPAENRFVYRTLSLRLENIEFDNYAVIAMPIDYGIIGRDLINRLCVRLDGPALRFTIE